MTTIRDSIRAQALPAIWSKGVRLNQGDSVLFEGAEGGEALFRVRAEGRAVPHEVILYLEDVDWTCSCDSEFSPCEHVIAAALYHADVASGRRSADAPKSVHLGYRLKRLDNASLLIQRVVVQGDSETPLNEPLTRILARPDRKLMTTQEDLEAERVLLAAASGKNRAAESRGLSPEGYVKVIAALVRSKSVTLDDKPVRTSEEPLSPRGSVKLRRATSQGRAERAVELRVERPKGVQVLDRGVGLLNNVLRPLGAVQVGGSRWERLPLEKTIAPEEIAELVTRVLPELEKEIVIDIEPGVLPGRGEDVRPRIHFDLTPQGHTLSVLPTLVYGEPIQIRIDGDKVIHISGDIPKRAPLLERELARRLKEDLSLVVGRVSHYDGGDAARFAKKIQTFQTVVSTTVSREVISKARLEPHLTIEGTELRLEFSTDEPTPRVADISAVFGSFSDGLDMVPLLDGGWAPLPTDWLEKYGDKVQELLGTRSPKGEVPLYATEALAELCEELALPPPREVSALRLIADNFESIPETEIPSVVPVELRSYQKQGVNWLRFLAGLGLGAVLADDMGLGKTLQTLCTAKKRTLVVSPKTVVFNWASECARFRPDLRVNIYHGAKRELRADADITLTTFAVLRMDEAKLSEEPWELIVIDEAQAIKNPESQLARAAFALTDKNPVMAQRIALSGTPIENRLDELWSIFRFTHPGLLGSRRDFTKRYAEPIARGDQSATVRLRRLVKPFLLRRLKRDVLRDLPPRTDVVLTVELEPDERTLYDAILAAKRKEVAEALRHGGSVMAALEALLRLRQACCHVSLLPGQKREHSSKVDALVDALEDACDSHHKSIVFSQWTSLLDLVEPELKARNIGFVRLDGETVDRARVVREFQADDGPPVFLSSLKAGGTGLNLTAADHVFLLDPWWNPAAEDQAADRAHRIGQARPVTVYRLIAKDTIEEGIIRLQAKKRDLSEAVLSEGGARGGLSREDLLWLLES
jgi:superfamily II DNA or RNA helicase